MFAKRDSIGQYSIEEINGTIGSNDTALVANRCYVTSPFQGESAIYFGGFDPNSNTSTNMAWVFKRDYLNTAAVDDVVLNENKFTIYPNPAINQIFIESEIPGDFEFSIINILGKEEVSGKINGKNNLVDISSIPPNVYILRVANESYKFIKTN